MIWTSFADFAAMGGYGLYVWGSYGGDLLLMTLACWAYAFAVIFTRARAIILERESHTAWVAERVGEAT